MAKTEKSAGKSGKDLRDEFAQRIVEMLEKGEAPPWRKRWDPKLLRAPQNAITGKPYTGMNEALLLLAGPAMGAGDHRWITSAQLMKLAEEQLKKTGYPKAFYEKNEKDAEGVVTKRGRGWVDGATNEPVPAEKVPAFKKKAPWLKLERWDFYSRRKEKDEQGRDVDVLARLSRPVCRPFVVYNLGDVENLTLERFQEKPAPVIENVERADQVLKLSGARIEHHDRDAAFYRPATDSVHLPQRDSFASPVAYYGTAMHELGHWTSHPSRLDRDLSSYSVSIEDRAREELRAELCSMFMAAETGIQPDLSQHGSYLASWAQVIKDKPSELFAAIQDAQRMADFLVEPVRQLELGQELAVEVQARLPLLHEVSRSGLDAALLGADDKGGLVVRLPEEKADWLVPLMEKAGRLQGAGLQVGSQEGLPVLVLRDAAALEPHAASQAVQQALTKAWPRAAGLDAPVIRLAVAGVERAAMERQSPEMSR